MNSIRLLLILCLALLTPGVRAQQLSGTTSEISGDSNGASNSGIIVERGRNPSRWGAVRVSLSLDRSQISLDDTVGMTIRVDQDAYIFVYTTDESGVTRQLLPNFYDSENLARAGVPLRIPSSLYRLRASTPGWQRITVHAVATGGDDYWRPDPRLMRLSAQDAFPIRKGGEAEMKSQLRQSVERGWLSRESKGAALLSSPDESKRQGIIVQPPARVPRAPCWGEATARLYVRNTNNARDTQAPRHADPSRPKPGKEKAELRVTSSPAGAELYLDNYFYGRTPITVDIPPDRYRVRVTKNGYTTWERQMQFKNGDKESFSVRLQKTD